MAGVRWVAATVALSVLAAGCGGSGDGDGAGGAGESASEADVVSATLEIITTNIETAVGDANFEEAEAGQELVVDDRVKTDETGFAELSYHDGSWQRVENNATLTLEELVDSDDAESVGTSVDVGRSWNRVRELSEPDDSYVLETPVASAAVRGTAFSTECPDENECTFKVVYGTVEVTPIDAEPIDVVAPATLTIRRNEIPGEPLTVPVDSLRVEPWIKKNLELDGERFAEDSSDDSGDDEEAAADPTSEELGTASASGIYDVVMTGVSTNYNAGTDGYMAPGSTVSSTVEVSQECRDDGCVAYRITDGESSDSDLGFDGTSYSETSQYLLDCIDPAGGGTTEDAVDMTVVTRIVPSAATFVDGAWVLDSMSGTESEIAGDIKPHAPDCTWEGATTDGQPFRQEATITMTRQK